MKIVTIKAVEIKKGHVILGISHGNYYVRTSDGIMTYNLNEMNEIYNYSELTSE